jgi:hypothetical protein
MTTPTVSPDFLLVPSTNSHLSHVRPIDAGGGGEVHEVCNLLSQYSLYQVRDDGSGKVKRPSSSGFGTNNLRGFRTEGHSPLGIYHRSGHSERNARRREALRS